MELCVFDQVLPFGPMGARGAAIDSVELCKEAERLGFGRYWVSEHHGQSSGCAAPEVLISAAANVTEIIRVGSASVLLPYYPPLKVAGTFNLLCRLYGARVDLGVGRGPGAAGVHIPLLERSNKNEYEASLRQLMVLLESGYQDGFLPSDARPELWVNGSGIESARFAARLGLPYCHASFIAHQDSLAVADVYRESFEAGPFSSSPKLGLAVRILTAGDTEVLGRLRAVFGFAERYGRLPTWAELDESGVKGPIPPNVVVGFGQEFADALLSKIEIYNPDLLVLNTVMPTHECRVDALSITREVLRGASRIGL